MANANPPIYLLAVVSHSGPNPSYLAGFGVRPKPTKRNMLAKELTIDYCNDLHPPYNRNNLPPMSFMDRHLADAAASFFNSLCPQKVKVFELRPVP